MQDDLVSVIIPIYKVEDYLPRCIDSVLVQTYSNLEIILVNDGSPDRCPQICQEYAKRDARIKVVNKENGGLSDARNAGMRVATGTFYYFLDSDDWIREQLIASCVQAMHESNADMVVFNFENVDESGKTWASDTFLEGEYDLTSNKKRFSFFAKHFFEYHCGFEAWNRMYRASVIKKERLRFAPNKLVFAEDICFNIGFLCCAKNIKVIPDRLYYYLHRNSSIMGRRKEKTGLDKYVNIALHNLGVVKQTQNKAFIREYPILYSMLLERVMQMDDFQERIQRLKKIKEDQQPFHQRMLRAYVTHLMLAVRLIGAKKACKMFFNNIFYLTKAESLGRVLQKIEF